MVVKKRYKIRVLTGLHIGAGKEGFEIGEMDNPVVKDFESGIPYIPGSSLKGKIRFLLENKYPKNKDEKKYELIQDLFGRPANESRVQQEKENNLDNKKSETDQKMMTILIIRDGFISEEIRDKIEERLKSGEPITEEKYENTLRGQQNLRQTERVPRGYVFEFEVVFRFYQVEESEREDYIKLFEEGLKLLEDDYLGGSGSRGYGKISVELIEGN